MVQDWLHELPTFVLSSRDYKSSLGQTQHVSVVAAYVMSEADLEILLLVTTNHVVDGVCSLLQDALALRLLLVGGAATQGVTRLLAARLGTLFTAGD